MKKFFILLLLVLVACAPMKGTDRRDHNLNHQLSSTVALVIPEDSDKRYPLQRYTKGHNHTAFCSGVVISNREVLTAQHCIDHLTDETWKLRAELSGVHVGPLVVKVSFYTDINKDGHHTSDYKLYQVKKYDEEKDLALLTLVKTESIPNVLPIIISARKKLVRGENVTAIGSPSPFLWNITKGLISSSRVNFGHLPVQFITNSDIYFGSSGGPAFDEYGHLIGICQVVYHKQSSLNGFVHITEIHEFLEI